MSEKRSALIIANSQYVDTVLRQLVAPAQDAEALAEVLQNPAISGFGVQTLLNAPSYKVCETIEAFFDDRERDHLVLLYFSGHGVTDDDGMLYFATSNTQRNRLRSTAVGAKWVNEIMIQCRSRRQVLLLDCCHSGAFARAKAATSVSTRQQFEAITPEAGRGRVVLTASDAMQYSFEGDQVEGQGVRSVFTQALVEGLRTGEADLDGDGQIKLDELYSYVHRRVRDKTPQQSPRRWDFDVEGEIVIAQNPRPTAAQLPDDLQHAIASFVPEAREAAILRLGGLLMGKHKGLALAAHKALLTLKEDDSRRVSGAAEKCLAAYSDEITGGKTDVREESAAAHPTSPKTDQPILTEKKMMERRSEPEKFKAESRGAQEIEAQPVSPEKPKQARLLRSEDEAKIPTAKEPPQEQPAQPMAVSSREPTAAVAGVPPAGEQDPHEFANLIGVRTKSIDWSKGFLFLACRLVQASAFLIFYSIAFPSPSWGLNTGGQRHLVGVFVFTVAILASFRWIQSVVGAAVAAGFGAILAIQTASLIFSKELSVYHFSFFLDVLFPYLFGFAFAIGLSYSVRFLRPLWLGLFVGTVIARAMILLCSLIYQVAQGNAFFHVVGDQWFSKETLCDLASFVVFSFCFWGGLRLLAKKRKPNRVGVSNRG